MRFHGSVGVVNKGSQTQTKPLRRLMTVPLTSMMHPSLLSSLLLLLGVVFLPSSRADAATYTRYDDATWPIITTQMPDRFPIQVEEYKHFIEMCREAAGDEADHRCGEEERFRLEMNTYQPWSVRNYTKLGYAKIRAPEAMFKLIKEFWDNNKDNSINEWGKVINTYHNMWESPPTIILVSNETLIGGGPQLNTLIWDVAREVLEEWTGQRLAPCSLYGIRIYHNNSILTPHTDRLPLVSSAIINVAQDVDEPWPLEVFGHDGIARNVTMEPGDMVLYESHSVIHGRPFRMKGKYFANIFIHFEAIGPMDGSPVPRDGDLPPYLVAGSPWEKQWRKDNPTGWQLESHDPHDVARKGDLRSLQDLELTNPSALHRSDPNGWRPVHESVRSGHTAMVEYLLEKGADMNERTNHGEGYSLLRLASMYLGQDHDIYKMLASKGALDLGPEL